MLTICNSLWQISSNNRFSQTCVETIETFRRVKQQLWHGDDGE